MAKDAQGCDTINYHADNRRQAVKLISRPSSSLASLASLFAPAGHICFYNCLLAKIVIVKE